VNIINKREESKIRTRTLILEKTKELIIKIGVLNLTTIAIAKECGIAHGSIFQHFGSREGLISIILEEEIKRIIVTMESSCSNIFDLKELLQSYLLVLLQEEEFLSRLYKELPFLSQEIQRSMISLEAILRNTFFMAIQRDANKKFNDSELTIRLDAFFSTIIRYLSLKEIYVSNGELIKTKGDDIRKLFEILF
jgi:AcrR family transcriptional regulator